MGRAGEESRWGEQAGIALWRTWESDSLGQGWRRLAHYLRCGYGPWCPEQLVWLVNQLVSLNGWLVNQLVSRNGWLVNQLGSLNGWLVNQLGSRNGSVPIGCRLSECSRALRPPMTHLVRIGDWAIPWLLSCPCLHVSVMPRSCLGHVSVMSRSCPGHVLVMSRSCPGHVSVMSLSCLAHVMVMSWSCPCHV